MAQEMTEMEAVFRDIRRGGISIMPDYTTYMYEPDGIMISHFSPSKLFILAGEIQEEEHPHRGNGCCQFFYYNEFHEEEFPHGFHSFAHFLECYMRMVRHPVPNYLDFWWLSNALPEERYDPNEFWYCDRCDVKSKEERYKCVKCPDIDICEKCYSEGGDGTECPECGKRTRWMGQSDWALRSFLVLFRAA